MWNASALTSYVIGANDGLLGTINDYLFEDTDLVIQHGENCHVADFMVDEVSWNIPYIVVDTESWWPGKQVLISRHSV